MIRWRFRLNIVVLFALASVAGAQQDSVVGIWESYQGVSDGEDLFHHRVLDISTDGTYELSDLSANPERPFHTEFGAFERNDSRFELKPDDGSPGLSLTVADGELIWEAPVPVRFTRGRTVDQDLMLGTWILLGRDDLPTGSEITLKPDGTYHAFIDGSGEEWGPFVIKGSGMVHWPTRATNDLVGVPGVWTDIDVSTDRLVYEIVDGISITATRSPVTLIRVTTWGEIKTNQN